MDQPATLRDIISTVFRVVIAAWMARPHLTGRRRH